MPYCLRVTEEEKIYEKLIRSSELADAPCAPGTLEMLAQFAVLSRLKEHENSTLYLEDAGLRRREPEGHRSARQVDTRSTATTPASTKA